MPPGGEVQPADGPVSPVGRHHPPGTPARPRGRRVQRGPRQHVGRGGRAAGGLVPALAPAPHARAAPAPRAARRPADQVGQDERTVRGAATAHSMTHFAAHFTARGAGTSHFTVRGAGTAHFTHVEFTHVTHVTHVTPHAKFTRHS